RRRRGPHRLPRVGGGGLRHGAGVHDRRRDDTKDDLRGVMPTPDSPRSILRRARELFRFVEVRFLLAALVTVVGVWLFVEIADAMAEGELDAIDRALILMMRTPGDPADPIGPAWFEEAMRDVTALGSLPVLALATGATAGYLLLKRSAPALVLLVAATAGGLLLSVVLKLAFGRARPELVPHLTAVLTASFPSGHSSMSAVVYLTIAALLARLVAEPGLKAYCIAVAL